MPEKITVSACLIVRNEEKALPECLDSIRPIVDEIVVVDTGSTDETVRLAREGGAEVHHFPWNDDFSAARNAALDQARGDWILVIDADERLEWSGGASFREPLKEKGKWGFLLTLVNIYEERSSSVLLLRLFRNNPKIRYTGIIHERVDPALVEVSGCFKDAVGKHPAMFRHLGYLAERRGEKAKDERDLRLLKKQAASDPDDAFNWYKLAVHPFIRKHLREEAEEALKRAWAIIRERDPDGTELAYAPEVAALLILDAVGHREMSRARSVAAEAKRLSGKSPNLHYALGLCALAEKKPDEAGFHLKSALSFDGKVMAYAPLKGVTNHLSLNSLSEVRFLQGAKDESRTLYEEAVRFLGSEPANAFHGSVETIAEQGDPGFAIILLNEASAAQPGDDFSWVRGGELLMELGLYARSLEWLKRGLSRVSDDRRIVEMIEYVRHNRFSCRN